MVKQFLDIIPLGVKGVQVLTYHSEEPLGSGQIVKIPYGEKNYKLGVVKGRAQKPKFKTKPVREKLDLPLLPDYMIPLAEWCAHYYATDLGEVLKTFIPARADIVPSTSTYSRNFVNEAAPVSPPMNEAQTSAVRTMLDKPEQGWLLHGVTGSGKTSVYVELCRRTLKSGKSAIILVPEIVLAAQVVAEFKNNINAPIIITHSRMTLKERRAAWHKCLAAKGPMVIIGPRSALFMPRHDLGLLVIDECHEPSYKQEQSFGYHARDLATQMSRLSKSLLVLGSATPSTQDIFLNRLGKLGIIELKEPIHANRRNLKIVDMRKQKAVISPLLTRELATNFKSNNQSLLFLNRRGSASQVVCSDCGYTANCSFCNIPRTWHGDDGKLRCHWCGRTQKLASKCPECSSLAWRFVGLGTKRVETEVAKILPQARILRLDKDSFSSKTIAADMKDLREGKIDVLIGTQMIAKGLDLPKVTLVGVVLADTMLQIPDIYSAERTYQLLHQFIGRAGRRENQTSSVVIQTYSPDHPAIKLASEHRYLEFVESELKERQEMNYPPYSHILKLTCKRKTQKGAQLASHTLAESLRKNFSELAVHGPAPAWREKQGSYWYWHLIVTSKKRSDLTKVAKQAPAKWRIELDPLDLL